MVTNYTIHEINEKKKDGEEVVTVVNFFYRRIMQNLRGRYT